MAFTLPDLPYAHDALAGSGMSEETLQYHHDLHHNAYVTKGNELIAGTPWEGADNAALPEVIKATYGKEQHQGLFNQVSQHWNHIQFWEMMAPGGTKMPSEVEKAINDAFGGWDQFRETFVNTSVGQFGSGWGWLVQNKADKSLAIVQTDDAKTPLTDSGVVPLLTCDVWEHAYYIDYRNARPKYMEAFWALVNWDFVAGNMK